jgi:acetyl esterase/lipase
MSVQQPARTVSYGPDPAQFGELYLPAAPGPFPVVALIHGDHSTVALAEDLRARGYAVWHVEHRARAGWPGTFADVAAAVDAIQDLGRSLDHRKVITIGHAVGGQLAVWAASRPDLPKQAPGFAPRVQPIGAVSLSGVLDLVAADADRGQLATDLIPLLGGHAAEYPERYAWTSPTMLNSGAVPVLAVHGIDDDVVPIRYGRNYLSAATARHEPVEFREFPGVGHVDLLDPAHPKWAEIVAWLEKRFTSG